VSTLCLNGEGSAVIEKIKNPPTPEHDVDEDEETDESGEEDDEEAGESEKGETEDEEEVEVIDEPELTEEERERQQQFQEFQDWVTSGEEYPSSDTLHDGAVATLERWHEPTRLSNPNASTRSAGGIYYARGDSIPVSIQGDQQRQASIDIELEWERNTLTSTPVCSSMDSSTCSTPKRRISTNFARGLIRTSLSSNTRCARRSRTVFRRNSTSKRRWCLPSAS